MPSRSIMSDSFWPHGLQPAWLLCPWEFSRQEYWSGLLYPPGDLPNPGIKPRSPALQADSLPSEPPGKPKNTGVSSLSLLQGIFPTQESNQGLLCCRRILYQLSYQGSRLWRYLSFWVMLMVMVFFNMCDILWFKRYFHHVEELSCFHGWLIKYGCWMSSDVILVSFRLWCCCYTHWGDVVMDYLVVIPQIPEIDYFWLWWVTV